MQINDEALTEILEKVQSGNMILFLGSGSTRLCLKGDGSPGLVGQGLANEILKAVNRGQDPNLKVSLTKAAEFFIANRPTARIGLDELIHDRLLGLQPTLAHYLLTLLPWKAIITTNYNMVVEEAYKEANVAKYALKTLNCVRYDGDFSTINKKSNIILYKPHGCISLTGQVRTPLIITSKDYFDSIGLRPEMYKELNSLVNQCSTLFVGYSLDDYTFKHIYYGTREQTGSWINKLYSIAPYRDSLYYDWEKAALAHNFNVELINTSFDAFMAKLVVKSHQKISQELEIRIKSLWQDTVERNKPYMDEIKLSQLISV